MEQLGRLKHDLEGVHIGVTHLYDEISNKIAIEQEKVRNISSQFELMKEKCNANENLEARLQKAVSLAKKYKRELTEERSHLYLFHTEVFKNKRVLKSVSSFYVYLLQRLAMLNAGIHHLKVVGANLR